MSHAFSAAESLYQTQLTTGDILVVSSGYGPKMAQVVLADTQEYLLNGNVSILLDSMIKEKQSNDADLSVKEALDLVIEDANNVINK
jgi:hypothetical protein